MNIFGSGVRRSVLRTVATVFAMGAIASADASTTGTSVEWLRHQVEANPDDPHLHRALARALTSAGDANGAAAQWKLIASRWPTSRPDVSFELGRACLAADDDACAVSAFEHAAALDPASGLVQLWLGLALRRLGRLEEASAALVRAAERAPELRQETLLLRGVDRVDGGDSANGERLLREAIEIDPTTETARRAQLLLPRRTEVSGANPVSLFANVGSEYDTNLALDSGLNLSRGTDDRDDVRGVFGAGGVWRPWQGENGSLAFGYRYDGSAHTDRLDYDLQGHLGFGSLLWSVNDRLSLRLDGMFSHLRLGDARYLQTRTIRPNVFIGLGDAIGVSRLYGDLERRSDFEEPTLNSLDQDGLAWGAGIEHTIPCPGWNGATVQLGGRFSRFDPSAGRDLFGFEAAYDSDRWDSGIVVSLPLRFETLLVASVNVALERYRHANVIDFLTDDGIGDARPEHRRDLVSEYGLTLSRPLGEHLSVDVNYRFTDRDSNVDLYAYDRHVVGVMLRFSTD